MMRKTKIGGAIGVAMLIAAMSALFVAPAAMAHTGEYAEFNYCPSTNPEVVECLYSKTTSGEVVLGKKKVPIVNPVVLQAGVREPDELGYSTLVDATNGVTLSKSPQPVPGGLSGLVNCKEISNYIVRVSCEVVFENGLTGVNATVELARPAKEVVFNNGNVLFQNGVGLKLPVKVHLENPFLGSSCYIGSSSTPIIWNLTSGTTSPPAPNSPITGSIGTVESKGPDEGILRLNGIRLVDNAWSAPGASGCGGFGVELILNPIINASVGVPSAAGKNTAILSGVADEASVQSVNSH